MRHALKNIDTSDVIRYQEFDSPPPVLATAKRLVWVAAPYVAPEPTEAEIIETMKEKVQKRLDDFAQTRGYDNILSACTYANSLVPKFAAEGMYCVTARDGTWATCYTIMANVQSHSRTMPTEAQLMAELPALVWPA